MSLYPKCLANLKSKPILLKLDHSLSKDLVHGTRTLKNIESVQRRAARFSKNEYSTSSGTVTKILNDLKWPTIEKKKLRKVVRLTMMFKVVSGLSAIQFPPYLYYLKGDRALGNSHPKKFIQVGAKTNKYQQSETGTPTQLVSWKSSQ